MQDKVCLLITTYNRSAQLANSLNRLCRLTTPDEVLVINDGGEDNCEEVVKSFEGRLPVRYIYNHNPGWSICSFARNVGVKNTDCNIIITSEPEILYMTDVVSQMLLAHKEYPNHLISAGTIYHMGEKAVLHPDMVIDPQERIKIEPVNESTNNPNPHNQQGYAKIQGWMATYTALYRKEWIEQVGGWDEQFPDVYGVDDIDIATRLRIKLGINQVVDKDIQVLHQHHNRPPASAGRATENNMKYMFDKRLSYNGVEDINNPQLIANQNIQWGQIKNK